MVHIRPFPLRLALAALALTATAPLAASVHKPKPAPAPPSRDERKAAAPSVAVARGRLFAVVLGPGPAWNHHQPFRGPGLDEHRRYWKQLMAEGRVASAGPLGDDTGLAVIRAGNQREADALIAADPAVKARILRGVVRPYKAELVSAPVLVGK